jgi:hypothetical protein
MHAVDASCLLHSARRAAFRYAHTLLGHAPYLATALSCRGAGACGRAPPHLPILFRGRNFECSSRLSTGQFGMHVDVPYPDRPPVGLPSK